MLSTPPAITPVRISSELLLGIVQESLVELERLLRADDWLAPDSVHDIRVLSKRMRAWWRLWRQTDLKPQAQRANQQLRQFSSQLSESRDAQVLSQHGRKLAQQWQDDAEFSRVAPLLQCLVDSLALPRSLQLPDRALMTELLDQQRTLLQGSAWPSELALAPLLAAGYNNIKGAAEQAFSQANSEAFHHWRKQVKALYYQGEMLILSGCHLDLEQQSGLKRLGAELGDLHDLDNLLGRWSPLRPAEMMTPEQASLIDALLRYQQRLRGQVADLYQASRFCKAEH